MVNEKSPFNRHAVGNFSKVSSNYVTSRRPCSCIFPRLVQLGEWCSKMFQEKTSWNLMLRMFVLFTPWSQLLVGPFNTFFHFHPEPAEMRQFDGCIFFQMGWWTNHQLEFFGWGGNFWWIPAFGNPGSCRSPFPIWFGLVGSPVVTLDLYVQLRKGRFVVFVTATGGAVVTHVGRQRFPSSHRIFWHMLVQESVKSPRFVWIVNMKRNPWKAIIWGVRTFWGWKYSSTRSIANPILKYFTILIGILRVWTRDPTHESK